MFVSENDPITSLEADAQPTATTNITNDESIEVAKMVVQPIHADYLASTDSGFTQDIKEFLAKPIELQTGSISSSDNATTFPNIEVLQSHLANAVSACKVSGFLGIRATQVFRLQINANRMQQGRYIMFWLPLGGAGTVAGANSTVELALRTTNKTTVTQLPHVEIDINNTTEAILEVPFISIFPYFPLGGATTTNHSLGIVRLYPYSPLSVPSGSSTASYSIYSTLKDIKLVGPTIPQMALGRKIPVGRPSDPTTSEQAEAGIGPISGMAKKVSVLGDSIASAFPALSVITAPVSWAADIIGGVASVFGWSNPIDLSEVSRAVQTIQPWANNCDMPDAAMPISLFGRNQVEILPGFAGSDIDEMSIDYIKTIPAYISSFTFTTSHHIGDSLYNLPITMDSFKTTFTDTGPQVINVNTPVAYLSKFFQVWRGSVRLTLKIVKTEFHSGRIEVIYIPQEPTGVNGDAPTTSTRDNRAFTHREIIDIRSGNQIDILVPYVSIVPWRAINEVLGNVQIYVINPLVAPSNVSSTITFLVEVAGGTDLMYNIPRTHNMTPVIPTVPQMAFATKSNQHAVVTRVIGNSTVTDHNYFESRACIGEQVLSISQLLKHSEIYINETTVGTNDNFYFDPFSLACSYNNAGTIVGIVSGEIMDNFTMFSNCYLFSRGGIRIRSCVAETTTSTFMPVVSYMDYAYSGTTPYAGFSTNTTTYAARPNNLHLFQNEIFRGGAEIQIPQYGRTHSRINSAKRYIASGISSVNYTTIGAVNPVINVKFSTVGLTRIFRQVADDFQLGFWLSTPPTQGE